MSIIAAAFFLLSSQTALADRFDDQISQARAQAAAARAQAEQYRDQAQDARARVNQLNARIRLLQADIDYNQAQANKTNADIEAATTQMAKSKDILGQNVKAMYLSSNVTALEMIASSNNLSEYFDKQQYQDTVKNKIEQTIAEVQALKKTLEDQRDRLNKLLAEQQLSRQQLAAQRAEADALLAQANSNAAAADATVRDANARISSLRAQQAAMFAQLSGASNGNLGSFTYRNLSFGGACGGGYPSVWCNAPTDSYVDSWDLYSRECVSYAAWAMSNRGGRVPEFNGQGNATQWPGYLAGRGYTVNNDPHGSRVVVIAPAAMIGGVGHAMVVEDANVGGGWIRVSQYNWWPSSSGPTGLYSVMEIKNAPGLRFIHF